MSSQHNPAISPKRMPAKRNKLIGISKNLVYWQLSSIVRISLRVYISVSGVESVLGLVTNSGMFVLISCNL